MKAINRIAVVIMAFVALAMTSCVQESALDAAIKAFNEKCPVTITEAIACTGAQVEGENVVYIYDIDENKILFDAVYDNLEQGGPVDWAKENMSYNEEAKKLMEVIEQANKSVINRYKGTSGSALDVEIGLEEIAEAVGAKKK